MIDDRDNRDDRDDRDRNDTPPDWPHLGSREGPNLHIFRVRHDRLRNPRTNRDLDRLVLETPDWVNVVAYTRERRLVLVRQYRFGVGAVTTEVPGGVIDRGEGHHAAAIRELREETGYTAPRWTYLGSVQANPAFQTNRCHHWLAEDAEATHAPEPDPGEDLRVLTATEDEARALVCSGEIAHSLVVSALCRVLDLRGTTA